MTTSLYAIAQEIDRMLALAASFVVPANFLPVAPGINCEFSAMDYGYPTHYVELQGGVRLAYIDVYEGSGEPQETIIFLHGLASYLQAWKRNIPELARHYRCIAIDLPGYGKSSKNHEISLDFYAAVIKNLATALQLHRVVLCGHSLGGQIAILAGLRYPKLVSKLILLSAAGLEYYTELERMLIKPFVRLPVPLFKYASPAIIYLAYAANFYSMPQEAMCMVRDRILWAHASGYDLYCKAVVQSFLAMGYAPVAPRLSAVQQPTLIIYGANDNFIPNWFMHGGTPHTVAQESAQRIPRAQYVIFERCGHFVPFEKPHETNQAITEFLSNSSTC
ncbi:MAG: alpha/beta hydrolase [Bacteroidota bacterium]|nr:alpha/beta hydrolase [Candidatus Kapabacteria bacterium]MDW8220465.1 alpha/beta hydrolase [Bacteroidota bacterium]